MNEGLGKRVLLGIKWTLTYKVLAQLFNWLSTLWVVRYLSPGDYGLNAMLEVPLELAMIVVIWGMSVALVQKKALELEEQQAIFGFMLLLNIAAFLIFQLFAERIASYFGEASLAPLLRVVAVVFLMVPFRIIPNAILDQKMQFKRRAQVDLTASVLGAATALIMAYAGAGVWALVGSVLVNYLVRSIVLAYIEPWFVLPSLRFTHARGTLSIGLKVVLSGTLIVMTNKAVDLIVGPAVGAQTLGLYAVAVQLAMLPISRILPIINQTLYPAFVQIQNDGERVRDYTLKSIQYAGLIVVPCSIGLYFVTDSLVDVVFGVSWHQIKTPLAMLALLLPVAMVRNLLMSNLVAMGRAGLQLWLYAMTLVLTGVLCIIFRSHGLMGLLWINLSSVLASTFVIFLSCRGFLRLSMFALLHHMRPALQGTLVMGLALMLFQGLAPPMLDSIQLMLMILIGVTSYLLTILAWSPEVYRELLAAIRVKE